MGDHRRVDVEPAEELAPPLAVHDDAVEAREQRPPEIALGGRSAWQQIVRGEDRRDTWPQHEPVELRRGQPLEMEHVRSASQQRRGARQVLGSFEREPQPRAAKESRRDRIERFTATVPVCRGYRSKAKV